MVFVGIEVMLKKAAKPENSRRALAFIGPAFVASVAYLDPGNFATNIAAGSQLGYVLLWVIFASNIMAQLIQYLSAKLGIATGKTLPELCRLHFPPFASLFLWAIAELAAAATDLAEFLGAALGIYLLFGLPLAASAAIAGIVSILLLSIHDYNFRKFEYAIMACVGIISIAYLFEMLLSNPDWGKVAFHTFVPTIGNDSTYLAVGILGATVMPHAIYLHSALVQPRVREGHGKRKHLKHSIADIAIAMNLAFLINAAMLVMAAAVFHSSGRQVVSIEEAHETLKPILGEAASAAFAIALLFSGLSSSAVGTMAGQVVMDGFLKLKIPVILRRMATMLPAFIVIFAGLDSMQVLVLSQVVLSFAIPFALIPLIIFTSDKKLMGRLANRGITTIAAWLAAAIIISLNAMLLWQALGGLL